MTKLQAKKRAKILVKEGNTLPEIAKKLFDEGYKSPITGKAISGSSVHYLLNGGAPRARTRRAPATPKTPGKDLKGTIQTIMNSNVSDTQKLLIIDMLTGGK